MSLVERFEGRIQGFSKAIQKSQDFGEIGTIRTRTIPWLTNKQANLSAARDLLVEAEAEYSQAGADYLDETIGDDEFEAAHSKILSSRLFLEQELLSRPRKRAEAVKPVIGEEVEPEEALVAMPTLPAVVAPQERAVTVRQFRPSQDFVRVAEWVNRVIGSRENVGAQIDNLQSMMA
ncbi:hypothetical protein HY024_01200, partial [Candidatus Curtissbacteria bacterium]|nr:hypothetical protein [Candidatus Curtissbacteria bacterium]